MPHCHNTGSDCKYLWDSYHLQARPIHWLLYGAAIYRRGSRDSAAFEIEQCSSKAPDEGVGWHVEQVALLGCPRPCVERHSVGSNQPPCGTKGGIPACQPCPVIEATKSDCRCSQDTTIPPLIADSSYPNGSGGESACMHAAPEGFYTDANLNSWVRLEAM